MPQDLQRAVYELEKIKINFEPSEEVRSFEVTPKRNIDNKIPYIFRNLENGSYSITPTYIKTDIYCPAIKPLERYNREDNEENYSRLIKPIFDCFLAKYFIGDIPDYHVDINTYTINQTGIVSCTIHWKKKNQGLFNAFAALNKQCLENFSDDFEEKNFEPEFPENIYPHSAKLQESRAIAQHFSGR